MKKLLFVFLIVFVVSIFMPVYGAESVKIINFSSKAKSTSVVHSILPAEQIEAATQMANDWFARSNVTVISHSVATACQYSGLAAARADCSSTISILYKSRPEKLKNKGGKTRWDNSLQTKTSFSLTR